MDRYKSIFLFAAAVLFLVLAGSLTLYAQPFGLGSPQAQQFSQYQPLCAANGRFVFGQISGSSKDRFMLDTATGRLWRVGESGRIGIYLTPVSYSLENGEYVNMPGDPAEAGKDDAEK